MIAEAGWLVERQLDPQAEVAFCAAVAAGEIIVEDLAGDDWTRIAELCAAYADLGLVGVDASVIALAERHRVLTIAMLDHRDFRVVRPAHVDAFELIPTPAP